MVTGAVKKDKQRLRNMSTKAQTIVKTRRRNLRGIKKGWIDKEEEVSSGNCYVKGGF